MLCGIVLSIALTAFSPGTTDCLEYVITPAQEVQLHKEHVRESQEARPITVVWEEPAEPAPEPVIPPQPHSIDWDALARCETPPHGEWDYGPHSGWGSGIFEGGLQFHPDTWDAFKPAGYPEAAYQATREQQIHVAEKVLDAQGLKAWPACTKKLGWR